jgi:hypothetical protein
MQRGVAAKSILFGDRVGRAACWVLGSGSRLRQQVDSCSLCAHFPDIHGLASAATGLGLGTYLLTPSGMCLLQYNETAIALYFGA